LHKTYLTSPGEAAANFRQRFGHASVTIAGDVLLDLLRIDETPVPEHPQILKRKEGDILHRGNKPFRDRFPVEKTLQDPTLDQVLFDQFRNILGLDRYIEDPFGINDHNGTHGAESVAAGLHQSDFAGKALFFEFGDQSLFHFEASGRVAARSSTEQQMRAKNFHVDFILLHMAISFRPVPKLRI
jgi:hypothetical protein